MKVFDNRDQDKIVEVGDLIIENETCYLVIRTYSEGFGALEMDSMEVILVEDTLQELIARFEGYTIVPKDKLELRLV